MVSGWCGYCGEESDELRMVGPVEFGGPWVEPLDGGEPDKRAGRRRLGKVEKVNERRG